MAKKHNRTRQKRQSKHRRKRTMIWGLVLYILILLIVLVPAKYTNSAFGYLAFCAMLILVIFSVVQLFIMKNQISILKDFNDVECTRGSDLELNITVTNKSFLMCARACVVFYISDLFGEDDTIVTSEFTIARKSNNEFPFSMKMEHVGRYGGGIKQIYLYDMLGFLTAEIKGEGKFEINVMPRIDSSQEFEISNKIPIENSKDFMTSQNDGYDYMGVREYAFGDSIKRIHWKLSAHSAGYMTKLMESSKENELSVIIDFICPDYDKEIKMQIYDCIVESSLSYTAAAQHKDLSSSLIFCDADKEINRIFPEPDNEFKEIVSLLPIIQSKPDKDFADAALLMETEEKTLNRSSNVALFTSTVSDEMIQGLIGIRRQNRSPVLHIVLPLDMVQREREDYIAPLRNLDDYAIPYHVILPKP